MSVPVELRNKIRGTFSWGNRIWEPLGVGLALLLCYHFLAIRIRTGGLPGGDEGSWLSVAAELSRGNGFTTRWLEVHFLTPFTLPRPDDFRYPALTSLIAIVFKIFGISIEAARWTVATIYLAFLATLFGVSRTVFGRWVGMATLWLAALSLLQLSWNSIVYTEGLFGLAVAILALWYWMGDRPSQPLHRLHPLPLIKFRWWFILGILTGVTYLVRSNGILFLPGIFWLAWLRKKNGISFLHPIVGGLGFLFITSPWLIRLAVQFGNPFHVAGSAGMLRDSGQSHTLTIAEFFALHPPLYPLERIFTGTVNFFSTLHFFEQGMEIIPLLFILVAIFFKKKFFGPGLLLGFLLTFLASVYVAFNSWAGLRYMSSLMPLIYAYGLSGLFLILDKIFNYNQTVKILALVIILIGLVLPAVGPHRFYERKLLTPAYAYRPNLADHISRMSERVNLNDNYFAGTLCKVNFLLENRNCVGLQELYDTTWFSRSVTAFHPKLVVLTHEETLDTMMIRAMSQMAAGGFKIDTIETGPLAVYFELQADTTAQLP